MEKVKRIWCYIQKPFEWGIVCPNCGGENIDWSEFEGCIWCYDCEKDIDNYDNPLSGPVPVGVARMVGIYLDQINLETGEIKKIE